MYEIEKRPAMTKILIVDDSETVRNKLSEELSFEGYTVVEASDGMMGLETLEENPDVSLVITDISMPVYDGITMCEEIQKREAINKIPIIALTTQSSDDFKVRGKAAGIVAWVLKPYAIKSLLGGINAVIKKFGNH